MQDNKRIVTEFLRALGKGDSAGVKAVLSDDAVAICTGTCLLSGSRNTAEVLTAVGMLSQGTKNGIEVKILNLTAEDERVSAEWEGRAVLADGRAYNNQYHFLFSLRNGKIYQLKEYMDTKLVQELFSPPAAA
jgi:uncharacterized protein